MNGDLKVDGQKIQKLIHTLWKKAARREPNTEGVYRYTFNGLEVYFRYYEKYGTADFVKLVSNIGVKDFMRVFPDLILLTNVQDVFVDMQEEYLIEEMHGFLDGTFNKLMNIPDLGEMSSEELQELTKRLESDLSEEAKDGYNWKLFLEAAGGPETPGPIQYLDLED